MNMQNITFVLKQKQIFEIEFIKKKNIFVLLDDSSDWIRWVFVWQAIVYSKKQIRFLLNFKSELTCPLSFAKTVIVDGLVCHFLCSFQRKTSGGLGWICFSRPHQIFDKQKKSWDFLLKYVCPTVIVCPARRIVFDGKWKRQTIFEWNVCWRKCSVKS